MFSRVWRFCVFINYTKIHTCLIQHVKEIIVPQSITTWSQLTKQNIHSQAEEEQSSLQIYCILWLRMTLVEIHQGSQYREQGSQYRDQESQYRD